MTAYLRGLVHDHVDWVEFFLGKRIARMVRR